MGGWGAEEGWEVGFLASGGFNRLSKCSLFLKLFSIEV